jgi:hypothetical protein
MFTHKGDGFVSQELGFHHSIHEVLLGTKQGNGIRIIGIWDKRRIQYIRGTMGMGNGFNMTTEAIPSLLILEFVVVVLVFLDTTFKELGKCGGRSTGGTTLGPVGKDVTCFKPKGYWRS